MEGLQYNDFGFEKDSDDDEEKDEKKEKQPLAALIESLKAKPEDKEEDKPKPSKEVLLESDEGEPLDNAPELDAEAPLEFLSREETEAVTRTMATERLSEIQNADEVELTTENLAAESFLENVEATGDIDQAYRETLIELGETATKPLSPTEESYIETESAIPIDPEALLQDAKNELSSGVSYKLARQPEAIEKPSPARKDHESTKGSKPTSEAQPAKAESKPHKLHSSIVDYLVGRRFARIAAENKQEIVENKLSNEVSQLQLDLASKETHVRQLAQNKVSLEKKPKPKKAESETETIGRVLIDSELPERPVGHRNEVAGISAHTMKHAELIKVASAVKVEGSSLKQIYETHLVGEKGLRRVVAEYLRGGNYVKALKRELVEREKDFERDPMLRDQGSTQPAAKSSTQLDDLLQKSGIDWSEPQPLVTPTKVKSHNLPALLNDIKSPSNPLRRVVDVVLIGSILALASIVVILILER